MLTRQIECQTFSLFRTMNFVFFIGKTYMLIFACKFAQTKTLPIKASTQYLRIFYFNSYFEFSVHPGAYSPCRSHNSMPHLPIHLLTMRTHSLRQIIYTHIWVYSPLKLGFPITCGNWVSGVEILVQKRHYYALQIKNIQCTIKFTINKLTISCMSCYGIFNLFVLAVYL
jgi:hypothetical protein